MLIKLKGRPDWYLLAAIIVLTGFGLLMIYEASAVAAFRDFGDRFYFVREQGKWFAVGFSGLLLMMMVSYKKIYHLALPLLVLTIIMLIAVFIPGLGVKTLGAQRWLKFGAFNLQPSELAKLSLVIYLSAWFSHPERGRLVSFLILLSILTGLVVLQPDLGTAVLIMMLAFILYFVAGAPIKHAFLLTPIVITLIVLLSVIAPYRLQRLVSLFNPQSDPLGASYHLRQILISLGSGGLFGLGLGQSLQKYEYLPEATTDSIFAIIGEELGFIGAVSLLLIFLFFLLRGFRIALKAPDKFGRLLATGIVSWIGLQAAINLSSMVALLPLTGIPLPFISYGGSSLIVLLIGVGILLNISRS